ncbi:hypothetical protein T11_9098, partial [Trichinella zimbabwensis]
MKTEENGDQSSAHQTPKPGKKATTKPQPPSTKEPPKGDSKKKDGSNHDESKALPIRSKPKPGIDSTSPRQPTQPGLPSKKGDRGDQTPADQLPVPGKATPSGPSSPSHDAVPGLPIPKRIS